MKRVPEPHRLRNTLISVGVVVCVLVAACWLIKVPQKVSGSCLLDPARRWTLTELRPGSFKAGTEDLLTGRLQHYRLYQFDRPAFVDLSLATLAVGPDQILQVSAGDVLATTQSTSLSIELLEKQTELAEAQSRLLILESGAKPAILERADLAVKLAQIELKAHELQNHRDRELYDQEILSVEGWEASQARLDILELDVEIAKAHRIELATGAGQEKLDGAMSEIAALERELAALQEMVAAQQIRAPIGGQLYLQNGSGPLLSIVDQDTMVARILVPQRKGQLPQSGQAMKVVVPGLPDGTFTGEVLRVNRQVTLTGAGPFVTVYGLFVNADGRLAAGMQGRAHIFGESTRLLHQMKQEIMTVFRQEVWPR